MSQSSRGSSSSSSNNNNNTKSPLPSNTSKRTNVVHNSQHLLHQKSSYKLPIINPRFAPAPAGGNSYANNSISSRPQQQQQQQLLSTTVNGPIASLSNIGISNSSHSNNRLATLANVSVAAAAAASKNHHHHHNHLTIANAPTSLANLARLGGVTLLPISSGSGNDLRPGNATNLAIDLNSYSTHHRDQPNGAAGQTTPAIHINNLNNKSYIQISGSQEPNRTTTSTSNNGRTDKFSPFFANSQWRVQRTSDILAQHGLEAVSSVRLLNHASSMDSNNLWLCTGSVGDNNAFTGATKIRQTIPTAFPASTTTLTTAANNNSCATKTNRRNHNPKQTTQSLGNNNINDTNQSSFVTESRFSDFLNSMGSYQPPQQTSDTSGILHNNTSMTRSFDSSSTDQDLNNSSLMKLMAILNNPALTITAVNNPPSSANSYCLDSNVSSNFSCSTRNNIDRNNHLSTFSLNLTKHQAKSSVQPEPVLGTDQVLSQTQPTSKSRVPQSAANLQLLFKSSTSQLANKSQRFTPTTNQAISTKSNLSRSNTTTNNSADGINSNPCQMNWSDKTKPDTYKPPSKQANSATIHNDVAVQPKTSLSVMADNEDYPNTGNEIHSRSNQNSTVSVQLLKHIASQARGADSDWMVAHDPDVVGRAALEPECIITNARSLLPFYKEAKYVQVNSKVRVKGALKRHPKTVFTTSEKRLFVSNKIHSTTENSDKVQEPFENMHISIINESKGKEVYVSEQHQVLSTMMADRSNLNDKANANGMIPEPDDIFINRPKKIMSKIDTMLERKKRKRFERISGRSAPKTISLEEQCEESEAEWSDNDSDVHDKLGFVTVQLPLDDEELTSSKKEHLYSLGLVSRYERQKISLENLERRINKITPLALEGRVQVPNDFKRIVDTVLKTGGKEVQMRVDSNIKRNDLPLIEGLSRNTSKLKMSYMSVLGLEKRSKRTTLYKLKNVDGASSNISVNKQLDLNTRAIYPNLDQRSSHNSYFSAPTHNDALTPNNPQSPRNELREQRSIKQRSQQPQQERQHVYLNCRDVVKPSKNEYMKSLGLMAS